jgi:hypothetical protein
MLSTRKRLAAVIAAIGVLASVAPVAGARAAIPGFPGLSGVAPLGVSPLGGDFAGSVGPCSRSSAEGQAGTGSYATQVCQGSGLSFVGPAVGQVASVIGPTIIGPTSIGSVVVSAGNVAGSGVGY